MGHGGYFYLHDAYAVLSQPTLQAAGQGALIFIFIYLASVPSFYKHGHRVWIVVVHAGKALREGNKGRAARCSGALLTQNSTP